MRRLGLIPTLLACAALVLPVVGLAQAQVETEEGPWEFETEVVPWNGAQPPTQVQGNDAVRANLAQQGDDGTVPRDVRHYTYPVAATSAPVSYVQSQLADMGFQTAVLENATIRFSQTTEVASAEFDRFTEALFDGLASVGWYYDGWEALVLQGQ